MVTLFPLDPIESIFCNRAGDAAQDRCAESAHHGADRSRDEPHEPINQLGDYTVMGVLSLCGFPLELFDLNFGLSAFILRRGPRREGIDP